MNTSCRNKYEDSSNISLSLNELEKYVIVL